jgi:hypothetical protein
MSHGHKVVLNSRKNHAYIKYTAFIQSHFVKLIGVENIYLWNELKGN